jgi:hypothetical protein
MRRVATFPGVCLSVTVLLTTALPLNADPGTEFFEKKIRPALVQHCYACHSTEATKNKGRLLLDSRAALLKGGESGPALVPGKPQESRLVKAIRYTDDQLKMPPKGKLPDAIIADFEKWIGMGAPDPRGEVKVTEKKGLSIEEGRKFWSFQSPRRHTVPVVKDTAWPRGNVDRFLLAALEAKGLKPNADAEKATLLRRVYFDLIGLPPTPEQVDAFVQDSSTEAFAKVVDGLLASSHFGERWGRHWLDVARYADSSGGGRSLLFKDAWHYRDYVIESFNSDKPYNRFLLEQIAGDLLSAATPKQRYEQVTATGFLVLGPTNYERQDKDALEMDVIDEQLDTVGRVVLGMTIGCARCHDHKFDPIPTKDYYALAGILRSTQTLIHDNVSRWVEQPLPMSAAEEVVVKKYEAEVAALKEKLRVAKEAEKKSGTPAVAAKGIVAPKDLPGIVLDDSQAKRVGTWTHSKYSGSYIGDGYLHDGNADKGKKTLTFTPVIPKAGRYEVRLAYTPGTNRATNAPVHILHLDGEFTGHVNQQETPPIDGRFISLGTFRFDTSGQWYIMVSNEKTLGHVIVDAVQLLPEDAERKEEPLPAPSPRSGEKGKAEDKFDVKKLEAELKKLTDAGEPRPVAMGVKEAAKIEDCHICIRGNFQNRGEKVARGFLQVLSAGETPNLTAQESGRRELAAWLTSADNPLTARVMVNRVWHHLFGAGLVRTVDEFGTTGETPSHPELLDHLALQFVQDGWSVKKLVRSLVLSHIYHIASTTRPEALKVDPENRLLCRANRRRLEAECIRDAILVVSDKLDRTAGGPTIKKGTTSEYGYTFDDTRRSVYTPVFRNRLLELFEAFDFPDPNLVIGKRNVSTVATQALYLMNSPFLMDQARHAALALLALPNLSDAQRVERAYRTALGRLPTAKEREIAVKFLASGGKATWERLYQALFASVDFRYVE